MNDPIWKAIPGYEDIYEASSVGDIRRTKTGRILKGAPNDRGYKNVVLCNKDGGKTFFIHRLVAMAFLGPRPERLDINHIDGIKTNNAASNLEYITHQENMRHANEVLDRIRPTRRRGPPKDMAKVHRGDTHASSKLSSQQVIEIRELLKNGKLQQREIAALYGISQTQIWRYKERLSWAHL